MFPVHYELTLTCNWLVSLDQMLFCHSAFLLIIMRTGVLIKFVIGVNIVQIFNTLNPYPNHSETY